MDKTYRVVQNSPESGGGLSITETTYAEYTMYNLDDLPEVISSAFHSHEECQEWLRREIEKARRLLQAYDSTDKNKIGVWL